MNLMVISYVGHKIGAPIRRNQERTVLNMQYTLHFGRVKICWNICLSGSDLGPMNPRKTGLVVGSWTQI